MKGVGEGQNGKKGLLFIQGARSSASAGMGGTVSQKGDGFIRALTQWVAPRVKVYSSNPTSEPSESRLALQCNTRWGSSGCCLFNETL